MLPRVRVNKRAPASHILALRSDVATLLDILGNADLVNLANYQAEQGSRDGARGLRALCPVTPSHRGFQRSQRWQLSEAQ